MRDFLRQFDPLTATIGYFWLFEKMKKRDISGMLGVSPTIVGDRMKEIVDRAA